MQHLHGGADGSERITEFVGQHRQELVLAHARLSQLVQQTQPLARDGDVVTNGFDEGDFVIVEPVLDPAGEG